ncbi:MAG: hypothetical protein ACK455_07080 [Bacteroidota bacterium]
MKTTLKKSIRKSRFLLAVLSFVVCQSITMAQTSWNTNGNAGSFSNFIGTTNNFPFLFRTNNVERMRIQPNGFVGIGVANPLQRLDIFGNLRVRGNIYVDQNVYQQGQFDADSIDAGLINASNLNANYVNTDSLKAYVIMMNEQSKFVGQTNFENSVKISDKLVIGELGINGESEKFEVRNGKAKFFGDVKLKQRLVFGENDYGISFVPSSDTDSTNYFRFGRDPLLVPSFNFCAYPKLSSRFDFDNGITVYKQSAYNGDLHTLNMFCDGGNAHIDVAGSNGNEIGGPSLLLNYYCGKDIHAVTGGNGGKLVVGKPQNTQLAFNVRGNTLLEGDADMFGSLVINGNSTTNGNSIINGDLNTIGNIKTKKVIICADGWCDYVFDKKYKLKSLFEVEKFIEENKHLPGIPSVKEIENKEVDIFQIQKMQMEKIEELTLYIIQLKKEIDNLKK